MLVYEILVCEFMSLCVDEDMGLWLCTNVVLRVYEDVGLCRYVFVWLLVCLLVRWHVGLQTAYRPLVPQEHSPLSLDGERGGKCFILFFLLPVLQNMFGFYLATSFPNSSCVTHEG